LFSPPSENIHKYETVLAKNLFSEEYFEIANKKYEAGHRFLCIFLLYSKLKQRLENFTMSLKHEQEQIAFDVGKHQWII
jgi:hypothetical protein